MDTKREKKQKEAFAAAVKKFNKSWDKGACPSTGLIKLTQLKEQTVPGPIEIHKFPDVYPFNQCVEQVSTVNGLPCSVHGYGVFLLEPFNVVYLFPGYDSWAAKLLVQERDPLVWN